MFNEKERKSYDNSYRMEGLLILVLIIMAIGAFGYSYNTFIANLFENITNALDIVKANK